MEVSRYWKGLTDTEVGDSLFSGADKHRFCFLIIELQLSCVIRFLIFDVSVYSSL